MEGGLNGLVIISLRRMQCRTATGLKHLERQHLQWCRQFNVLQRSARTRRRHTHPLIITRADIPCPPYTLSCRSLARNSTSVRDDDTKRSRGCISVAGTAARKLTGRLTTSTRTSLCKGMGRSELPKVSLCALYGRVHGRQKRARPNCVYHLYLHASRLLSRSHPLARIASRFVGTSNNAIPSSLASHHPALTARDNANTSSCTEFKEIRKEWKAKKKEEEAARKADEERQRQSAQAEGRDGAPNGTEAPVYGQVRPHMGALTPQMGGPHLPPIGYAPAGQGQAPQPYGTQSPGGIDGMAQYAANNQVYSNGNSNGSSYPPSPYGQPNQMYQQRRPPSSGL